MKTKLRKVGRGLGLIMEPSVLEQLRIDKDTPLDVSIDGDTLVIRPVRESRSERVRAAAMRVADRHATAFERLAK